MYTAREGVYMRALEDKANIPMDLPLQSAANFHCSPAASINDDGSFDMGPLPLPHRSALESGCLNGLIKRVRRLLSVKAA